MSDEPRPADPLAAEVAEHREYVPADLELRARPWCARCAQTWPCLVRRLADRVAYLEQIFKGVASLTRCERHSGLPTNEQVERIMAPWCRDCLAEDYRALVAGTVEATTMAERYKACSERAIGLQIKNHRLKQALAAALAAPDAGEEPAP